MMSEHEEDPTSEVLDAISTATSKGAVDVESAELESADTLPPTKRLPDDPTADKPASELVKRMTCLAVAPREQNSAFLDDAYGAAFELTSSIAHGQQQSSSEVRRAFRELLTANSEALHSRRRASQRKTDEATKPQSEARSPPNKLHSMGGVDAVVAP